MCTQMRGKLKLVKLGPNVVERLRAFREDAEVDKVPLSYPMPLVEVLADVCKLLGLSLAQRREVLGGEGERYMKNVETIPPPIRLKKRANGRKAIRPVRTR